MGFFDWWPDWLKPHGTIGDPPGTRASFIVIREQPMTLEVGGDIDHTFTFDIWAVRGDTAIVALYVIAADDLRLEVTLNDQAFSRSIRSGPQRTIHRAVENAVSSGSNELTLRVLEGRCVFSDIVLWYYCG